MVEHRIMHTLETHSCTIYQMIEALDAVNTGSKEVSDSVANTGQEPTKLVTTVKMRHLNLKVDVK